MSATPRIVAIDGPAGSGKTTLARGLAERFRLPHLNTGASLRAVALAARRSGVALDDAPALVALARRVRLDDAGGVRLDGVDVSAEVRAPDVGVASSKVAVCRPLRVALLANWREAAGDGAVVEGRDIGTVVFPDAPVKLFLQARRGVRAERRSRDEGGRDAQVVEADLHRRDGTDSGRAVAPLRRAEDAEVVDTSDLAPAETLARVVTLVEAAFGGQPGPSADA